MRGVQGLYLLGIAIFAGALAHHSHRRTDELRYATQAAELALAEPNGAALRVASLGFHTALADLMWVRAIQRFIDVYEGGEPEKVHWLAASINAVADLDPNWRTVYFYGGSLLRVVGDIDGSDAIYARGAQQRPDDAFFPFSIGMNAYLYKEDKARAFEWVNKAAQIPGAPAWYGAAAAAFLEEHGERQAGLAYLAQQLKTETRPAARQALERRMAILLHDERAEEIAARRVAVEAQKGGPIRDIAELGPLPDDPYGQGWVLAPDGVIRSALREGFEAQRVRNAERALLTKPFPTGP